MDCSSYSSDSFECRFDGVRRCNDGSLILTFIAPQDPMLGLLVALMAILVSCVAEPALFTPPTGPDGLDFGALSAPVFPTQVNPHRALSPLLPSEIRRVGGRWH